MLSRRLDDSSASSGPLLVGKLDYLPGNAHCVRKGAVLIQDDTLNSAHLAERIIDSVIFVTLSSYSSTARCEDGSHPRTLSSAQSKTSASAYFF
jgi:hypothetical protein